eukprot:1471463-Amphidinium_carterae.1
MPRAHPGKIRLLRSRLQKLLLQCSISKWHTCHPVVVVTENTVLDHKNASMECSFQQQACASRLDGIGRWGTCGVLDASQAV